MKILFTGASSFTGHCFACQLAQAGHEVTVTFTCGSPEEYSDAVRRQRVSRVVDCCTPVFGCRFGDDRFLEIIKCGQFDVLCHHAATVKEYRSPDFDVCAALAANTFRVNQVLQSLGELGCRRVVITGSVFEGGEGAGSDGLPHFSSYGLSKSLTAALFRYYCQALDLRLGKFVIPNPFGPFEDARFTAYLCQKWFASETASVRTPRYVRDNIHVSLLALAYRAFVENLARQPGYEQINPSGYVETQGAFAQRVAAAMQQRLGLSCELELAQQCDFDEPRIRINTDVLDEQQLKWSEPSAWDEFAAYYERRLRRGASE